MNVLITGAAGGLGRAFAAECASRGFDLFLTDISAPALEAIKTGITRRYDVSVHTEVCDLTAPEAVCTMLDRAAELGVEFDMLLNNAGIDFEGGFTERAAGELSAIVEINIAATLRITHEVLERRSREKQLYIVFVSSLASISPMPLKACYAASKRFLTDFAYALGSELRSSGVSVMSVCPGGLATNDEAIAGIAAQGFWGDLTTNPVERLARRTITKALRGRRVYTPGVINRALSVAGKLLPRAFITWTVRGKWQNARAERGLGFA
ncbi:MAG: SDR family NAD(P)-dependent oxidoreductase [Oscillospiraceae bacterium]|nr:SDR family NAD(P)-dependent oxidoreductase [Oscillospiraceae bacterium]